MNLIAGFLKTPIRDKDGNDYSCEKEGIPQGSAVSPNCFLHSLDIVLEKQRMKADGSPLFFYLRYADDLIFGIPVGSPHDGKLIRKI